MIRLIKSFIAYLFSDVRVFYSFFFCLKNLPFNQAVKLPIIFYKHSYGTVSHGGKIVISDEFFQKRNKIIIGLPAKDFEYQCEKTYFKVEFGSITFNGKFEARRGVIMDIKGKVVMGDDILFGPRCRLRVHNAATFGNYIRIAHETQIFDSNFHFMEKVDEPGYYPISRPIAIGSYCWIGNRTTINPGTNLPDYITVASNSLLNTDYSNLSSYSIIGGTPAKFIKGGYTRVWDTKREFEYQKREFAWYREIYKDFIIK